MRLGVGYPLSVIRDVIQTILGWTVVILVTLVVGQSLGTCLGHGKLCGVDQLLNELPWYSLAWLTPQGAVAWAVTGVSWYLPIHYEGAWAKVCAATANCLTWTVLLTWYLRN